MDAKEKYRIWLDRLDEDDPMKVELENICGDEDEITDRFYRDIAFGTAGLRGVCGAGTNRMNELTVGRATQGIAEFILASGEDPMQGAVIAYDCRYHSKEFSELAARILNANGIKAYMFPEMRPTPELSYLIRKLGAVTGINMTASHNPKEYNGYKVYWKDGAQISGEISDGMSEKIESRDLFDRAPEMPAQEAAEKGFLVMLGEKEDSEYLDNVLSMAMRDGDELDLDVPVVYTPLNGAGKIPIEKVIEKRGFRNVIMVPEQEMPDPEFTTVGYPNPEDPKAFALSEVLGKKTGAEVLIATDPDADRMAIEVKDGEEYRFLNGNQTGAMLIAYMADSMDSRGLLRDRKYALIKSIVTGDMGRVIADSYGIETFEALTGFKNICGRIPELEEKGYSYFFGYEESIGCAPSERVRDKDGITAAMLICEMAAFCRKKGMTIADYLESLYRKYGYFAEKQVSFVLEGSEGSARISRIMDTFRTDSKLLPAEWEKIDFAGGYKDIPPSNVLIYRLDKDTWFAMRPSGTEPKIKFYYYSKADSMELSEGKVGQLADKIGAIVAEIQ
ncbi:MAG: phospho-sugar mutase [Eubacterium sp.]|nr:phospho-sugar mutase [Eubacterium sp.]